MMCIQYDFMEWFISPIAFGIASSIFFALGIWLIQQIRYWRVLRCKFHQTTYQTYNKHFPDKVIQEVTLVVKNNIIHFKGKRMSDGTSFSGQFIVNPINLKVAEGYHNHTADEGFGFMKMIINEQDEFLIEAPYTRMANFKNKETGKINANVTGERIEQAFVWRKKDNIV